MSRVFFVTVRDPNNEKRFEFLAGPYDSEPEAREHIGAVKALVVHDGLDDFGQYAYGTASVKSEAVDSIKPRFGYVGAGEVKR